jgi:hypothetical protein
MRSPENSLWRDTGIHWSNRSRWSIRQVSANSPRLQFVAHAVVYTVAWNAGTISGIDILSVRNHSDTDRSRTRDGGKSIPSALLAIIRIAEAGKIPPRRPSPDPRTILSTRTFVELREYADIAS